jgi:CHAD domain-containing protein
MALDRNRLLKPAKKLKKLIKKIGKQPPPDEVHDLRTNARRFEAMFKAFSLNSRGLRKSLLNDLGRLRKRAGKVRDMDVLTGYASTVHPQGEEDCSVQLLEHLGVERRKYAKKLTAEVRRLGPDLRKRFKRIPAIVEKLDRQKRDAAQESTAAADASAAAVRLATELGLPPRLGRDNLHPYRLKVKELRNVLQMGAGASQQKFVDDLGKVKDAIGEWHDWEELVALAPKVLDHGKSCGLITELRNIAKKKYEHALALAKTLRKTYLRSPRQPNKRASAASSTTPSEPVWNVTAMLAG